MRCMHSSVVRAVRAISSGSFILSFSRPPLSFRAGQHVFLSLPGYAVERAYSLYSAESEPEWRVLIREIPGGALTPALRHCRPGDRLLVSPPFGDFTLPREAASKSECLFLATGTGIAPFHSM
ncbi:MAG: FAD-binding oxidoreductase, partial [Kiritimatiellia bacterium]|nr:FAD-binding oxidoreductase [Kiritimatiellia bacterium]